MTNFCNYFKSILHGNELQKGCFNDKDWSINTNETKIVRQSKTASKMESFPNSACEIKLYMVADSKMVYISIAA